MGKPEDVYREFFRADRAKDARAWAAVNHYPHVRVAGPGGFAYYETAEEYASDASWTEREATGWVYTEGIEPVRLHESADHIHLAGGWTRYDADDEAILQNRVLYVMTRIDGSWGIQARFACGAVPVWQSADDADPAATVRRYSDALRLRNWSLASALVRYPFAEVGVGSVKRSPNAAAFAQRLPLLPEGDCTIDSACVAQGGMRGANVAATVRTPGRKAEAVFLMAKEAASWRIAAMSIII